MSYASRICLYNLSVTGISSILNQPPSKSIMPKIFLSLLPAICLSTSLIGCNVKDRSSIPEPGDHKVRALEAISSAHAIKAHMSFLADDLLQGRDAGSRGEALSALYVASEFEQLGLQPMGEQQSFIQPVPLRTAMLDQDSVKFVIEGETGSEDGAGSMVFANGEDIAVFGSLTNTSIAATAGLVFAGHGITAPELGLSDYAGLDVAGKVVVVLGGPPAFIPAAEAAHFGSTAQKQKMAAAEGAIGLIRLWTPANEAQVSFGLLKRFLARPAMTWLALGGQVKDTAPEIIIRATVRGKAAEYLFDGAALSAAEVIQQGNNGPVTGFALAKSVSLRLTTDHNDDVFSANVAGFLAGSNPKFKDEVVVVTAHYDHVGLCGAIDAQDRICNGALDNALGTAAMMDVARRFSLSATRPKRSILFLAVGAEEKGLLGSDYFVNFPTLGESRIVANINMDGGMPFYEFSDVIAFGAEQSELGEILALAIEPMNLTVTPDPFPELSIFTRSDQYSFVLQGVPSVFLYHGFNNIEGENVGRAWWDEMLATHYHQPPDDLSLPIRYDIAAKYSEVFYRLTAAVSDADEAPKWYEDSFFGQHFAPSRPKAVRRQY